MMMMMMRRRRRRRRTIIIITIIIITIITITIITIITITTIIIIIIITTTTTTTPIATTIIITTTTTMSIFLEHISMSNMLNCAEQVEIQKYKTHARKTLKTAGVQTILLKHPTEQLKILFTHKSQILYQCTHK